MCQTGTELSLQSVLIVDDMPDNLALLVQVVRRQGYRARPVPNGRLAIEAARAEQPDLILLDVRMPEMGGYEVCRTLKADAGLRDIPVIFMSAFDGAEERRDAYLAGAADYITKPFGLHEVEARVRAQLELRRLARALDDATARLHALEAGSQKESG